MNLTPEQHHEDCDHRNSHVAKETAETLNVDVEQHREVFDCSLDCEATAMDLPHITRDELLMMIVGLERLRDDNKAETKRYTAMQTELATTFARECRTESVQAENLRGRLKNTPNYRP